MKNFTKNMLHGNYGYPMRWLAGVVMLIAMLMGTTATAQMATLGSGTAVSVADSGSGLGPVNSYYANMHYQVVYTAAEITAAGGAAGLVSQFGWNVSAVSSVVLPNYKIRMAQTTATNSAAHNTAALTEVYNSNYTSSVGYDMFTLTSPFVWDGTSNILVDICYGPADFDEDFGQVFVYGTDAGSSRYSRSDYDDQCAVATTITNAFKPQARFLFTEVPSCFAPTGITAAASASTSATVRWTAVATAPAGGYEYYYSATNTAPTNATVASGTVTTGTTAQLTSLPVFTTQYVWVRSKCGDANFSEWAGPVSFTSFPAASALPYTEDFESANPQFVISNGNQVNKWVVGTATSNGTASTRSLYISDDDGVTNDYTNNVTAAVHAFKDIALPENIQQVNIAFDYRGVGESTYDYVRVWAVPATYVPTPGTAITTANSVTGVILADFVNLRANYTRLSYDVAAAAYAGQTIRLVFEWRNDNSGGVVPPAAIDNISISAVTCFAPSAVTVASLPGSVNLNWTAPAIVPASGYDYYFSTTNTAPVAATQPLGNVATGTSATITTLTADTVYYVWVRSNCGGTDTGLWVSGGSFRTECVASLPSASIETFATYDGSANSPACWKEATGALTATPAALTLASSGWTNENYGNAAGDNGRAARVELWSTINAWLISPAIDLGNGTTNYQLEYNTVVKPWSGTDVVTAMGEKYVKVVISTDGGLTWSDANVIRTYDNTNIPSTSRIETIQLEGYTGVVKIGFYGFSTTTDQDLRFYIDNFRVRETPACLNPLALTLGTVAETTAQISWTAPSTAPSAGYQYYTSQTNTAPTAATPATGSVDAGVVTALVGSLTPSTVNYVWVRSNCGDSQSEWVGPISFRTLCDAPEILTNSPATICGIGTATLAATATGGTISWYAAATGGNALSSGASFTTPQISQTTTYYVSAGNVGTPTAGGAKVTPTPAGGGTTASNYGLVFNVTSGFTLNSVDVFLNSTTAGNVVVVLQNSTGTQLETATIAVPAGDSTTPVQHTLNLGWQIPVGTGYRLLAVSGPSMLRESTTVFPYSVGGSGNVTSGYSFGGTSSTYYYFYNWNFTEVCSSPRVAVTATVTTAPAIEVAVTDAQICVGESTQVSVTSSNEDYTYVWTPGNLEGEMQTVTPTETTEYTVTATDETSGCVNVQTVTVTVNELPGAIAITPVTSPVCANAVQPLTVTGAGAPAEATFGTGTTAPGLNLFPNPFSAYYGGVKTQILFREDELLAQGLVIGAPINSISFDFFASAANANNDLRIKMGSTTLDAFTNAFVASSSLTTVYNETFTPTAGTTGWVPFVLTTSYVYTGGNLIIEVAHNAGNSGNGNGTRTNTTETAFNSVYTGAVDRITPAGVASLDALAQTGFSVNAPNVQRPNVVFNYTSTNAVTWSPVTNLYTDADATVAYTAGTAATTVYFKSGEAATTTYTATSTTAAGCSVSTTASIAVTTTASPVVADAVQTFCSQGTIGGLIATGTSIEWYANATGGLALASDVALVDGAVYYASQIIEGCSSTVRIPVTVEITTVAIDTPQDVITCNSYTLPALVNGNYYTQTNGGGTMVAAGTVITQTTTLFIYAVTNTTPACSNQVTFIVTINSADAPTGISPQTINVATPAAATIEDIEVTTTGTVTWYATEADALAGENALAAGTQVTAGSTYYATQTVGECTSTDVLAVTIEAIMGDKGFDVASFSYYPNPVSNVLNLSYSSEITSVAVFNLVGQQVMVQQPKATTAKLDTSLLAEGTYIVRITAGNAVKTIKVVKKGN